jgi:hypothetical protein
MYPVTTCGSFARYFLRSFDEAPKTTLVSFIALVPIVVGKNQNPCSLARFASSLFVDLFLLLACERASSWLQWRR